MEPQDSELLLLAHLVSQRLDPLAVPVHQWPQIVSLARRHGLAPVLRWRLKQSDAEVMEAALWQSLSKLATRVSQTYLLLERAQHQIQHGLEKAGIPCIWLKGSTLASTVYAHPFLRPMRDLDFLVPYEQREEALATVAALGYREKPDDTAGLESHHYHLVGGIRNLVHIELHFWLLGKNQSELISTEQLQWFLSQTERVKISSRQSVLGFTPEANLLYLCAHAFLQHGEASTTLCHIFDLHQLLHTHPSFDWDFTVKKAIELNWAYAVEQALRKSVFFFETPLPEWVLPTLREKRSENDFVQRARFLQGNGANFEHAWRHFQRLTLSDKLHFVYQVLLPSRSYMRERYRIADSSAIWPHYLKRWWSQGKAAVNALGNRFRLFKNRRDLQ